MKLVLEPREGSELITLSLLVPPRSHYLSDLGQLSHCAGAQEGYVLLHSLVLFARDRREANPGALGGTSRVCASRSGHPLPSLRETGGGTLPSKPGICHLRAKDELIELR